jgi:surface carbohydrate biosynthesis protein
MTTNSSATKVLLPVEIRSRELSGKLFLATVLADRGYDVYLGNKIQHTALDAIDPHIYFETNSIDHEDRFRRLREHGIKILVLETEGSAFPGPEEFSRAQGQETLKYADCYCAWGGVAKDVVQEVSPGTRVETTGNPRFDLLQKPHRSFYSQRASQLNEKYGEFILFNLNFALANGQKRVRQTATNFEDDHPVLKRVMSTLRTQTKIFAEFIRIIAEVAERFPERNIIVRPHPGEDPSIYENSLYAHENVHVERRFEARPWILAAETVVHNSCTTGVTSALLDTPVIAYVPDELETNSVPNEISDRCGSVSEVCNSIRNYLLGETSFSIDSDTRSKIRRHIDNMDYLSVRKIADILDSLSVDDAVRTGLPTDKKLWFRRNLVRTFGSKRFEEYYVKQVRGEDRQKFPYTSTDEVKSIVERFDETIQPADLRIGRLPYMVNGFRIWCDK